MFVPVPLKSQIIAASLDPTRFMPFWAKAVGIFNAEQLQEAKDWYVANINPSGEVPVLVDSQASPGNDMVKESELVAEYLVSTLDSREKASGGSHPIFLNGDVDRPQDVYRFRLCMKLFNPMPLYHLLMNQDPERDESHLKEVNQMLKKFVAGMKGPFCLGEQWSYADVHAYPFIFRFVHSLKEYRKLDLLHPDQKADYDALKLRIWFEHCSRVECFAQTSPTQQEAVAGYLGYSHGLQYDAAKGVYTGRGHDLLGGRNRSS